MRALPLLVAAVLGVATAFLAACGDRSGLIPATDAASLDHALSDVAAATRSGDCTQAQAAVARADRALASLPASVDHRLVVRLRSGVRNLEVRVPVACRAAGSTPAPTTTDTTTTDTTTTDTTPTDTTTTDTTTTDTTPTDTTTTDTTPTGTTTPQPPATSGTTGATGGATPGPGGGT
jgi:hypothetical protein